jgi:hypothetical protein
MLTGCLRRPVILSDEGDLRNKPETSLIREPFNGFIKVKIKNNLYIFRKKFTSHE